MPDLPTWVETLFAVITTAIVAPILVKRFAPQWQRQKTEADAEHTEAQTERTEVEMLKGIILALDGQYNKIIEENAALRSRCEKEANVNRVLHEQKVHAEAYLTIAWARLAHYEGQALTNDKDAPGDNAE